MLTRHILLLWAGIVLIAGQPAADPAPSAPLRIGGTGAVTALLTQIAPAFEAETGFTLQAVPSLGTTGANAAVADGVLGLAVSGRDLNQAEAARGLSVAATLRTPFGFVSSRAGPDNLDSTQIPALYRADRAKWADGSPVRIILRPTDESDNWVLGALFPGMADAIRQARKRSDLSIAATDQDNAEMAEKVAGSLVAATLVQMTTEKHALQFVSIDGVAPTLENYENGSYPYAKHLQLVVPRQVSPAAAAFLAFLRSPEAASLLRKAGIVASAG